MDAERQQRVEDLRRLVATGRYEVDPEAVAEAMIDRAMRDQALEALPGPLPPGLRPRSRDVLETR